MITTFNKDCNIGLSEIPDQSIEIVLTDPPYKYLKNQKLEVDFDETVFFDHVKRVLKRDGFIVMFGRGTSFYRWNTMLADRGFQFKEEIVWNKVYTSSPVTPISRVHECATIHSIDGSINTSFVGYCEMRTDLKQVIYDVNRIKSALNNTQELNELISFLKTGELEFKGGRRVLGNSTTVQSAMRDTGKAVKTLQSIQKGMKEKSIIELNRDHYTSIHPTQKPVRLLERLLALVIKNGGGTVLDPFMGSGSSAIAAYNMGLDFIGYEIDKEYFEGAENRIKEHTRQLKLQF